MKHETFVDVLRSWAERQPERTALTFLEDGESPSGELTYASLDERARAVAVRLRQTVQAGDRVLLLHLPGLEFVTAFFGCLYAGVVAIPAYPPRNARHFPRIEAIVRDADAACVLTQTAMEDRLTSWLDQRAGTLPVICTDRESGDAAAGWMPPRIDAESLAFLQYTSGSTGAPKGVMVTHRNLMANQRQMQRAMRTAEGLTAVSWLPIYHDMGLIGNVLQPLFRGGHCAFMAPAAFLQKPRRWLSAITRYGAQFSGGPNFAFRLCTRVIRDEQKQGLDLRTLDCLLCGAEPIDAEVMEEFVAAFAETGLRRGAIFCGYGMAETTLMASGTLSDRGPRYEAVDADALATGDARPVDEWTTHRRAIVSCGEPAEAQDLVIVDPKDCRVLADGIVGEIWVRGSNVTSGYWRKPELTRDQFHARLSDADGGGGPFLRTGDLGYLRDGELFVIGRIKDLIIVRGRNHSPHDIELTVQGSHPALREDAGAAFSVVIDGEERLVVVQEIDRHQHRDAEPAVAAIRAAIAEEHEITPHTILLVRQNGVLKTSSGKIQRSACANAFRERDFPVVHEWHEEVSMAAAAPVAVGPGRSCEELEDFLARQLAATLRVPVESLDVTQPFNSLGLDSLQTMTLLGDVEIALGQELSPTLFWNYPTIAELAAHLAVAPAESVAAADDGGRRS
jgi:acyl-CoA synthetase (AMP-forming)/AMP-acid ligase II/acyl carrier protein